MKYNRNKGRSIPVFLFYLTESQMTDGVMRSDTRIQNQNLPSCIVLKTLVVPLLLHPVLVHAATAATYSVNGSRPKT